MSLYYSPYYILINKMIDKGETRYECSKQATDTRIAGVGGGWLWERVVHDRT